MGDPAPDLPGLGGVAGWGGGRVYDYSWQVWGNTYTKLELAGVGEEEGKRGRGK